MTKKLRINILLITIMFLLTGCGKVTHHDISEPVTERKAITEEEKNILINKVEELKYLDYYGKSIKTNDLTNQEVLQILNSLYGGLNNIAFSELESAALTRFNYYLNPEDVSCDTHGTFFSEGDDIYKYSPTEKIYRINPNHTGHKDVGVKVNIYNTYKDSYKENNIYTIAIYKVFSELLNSDNTNSNNYYRTYNEALSKTNLLFTSASDIPSKMSENISELKTFTYTFEKKDDNYVLKEYTIS